MSSRRLNPVDGSGELDRFNMALSSQRKQIAAGASAAGASAAAASALVANIDGFYAWLVPVWAVQFGRASVLNRQRDATGLGIVASGVNDHQLNGVDTIGEACTVKTAE